MAFYQCLEDFDNVMENLNYNCTSDNIKMFHVMKKSLSSFEDQIFLLRYHGELIDDIKNH